MTIKKLSDNVAGLRYIFDSLEILSAPGKKMLREFPVLTDATEINRALDEVDSTRRAVSALENGKAVTALRHVLMNVNDIHSTIKRLYDGAVLDDIELFELKTMAMQSLEVARLNRETGITAADIPDVTSAVEILDPENTKAPYFYIYNAYSPELAEVRERLKSADPDSSEAAELFAEASRIEETVRTRLSASLRPMADSLRRALTGMGKTDLLIAKALLADSMGLSRPEVCNEGDISYEGLFNPQVADALGSKRKVFQPVDIAAGSGVTLITGANMGGKSVVLKTLALAQAMMQTGMYVPAARARAIPVDEIITSIGDSQSELTGLSSFAAEMLAIDRAVRREAGSDRLLILIDEPARTTNPEEGRAIVRAILSYFSSAKAVTVVTSHYSGLTATRHLRVRGLSENTSGTLHKPSDIAELMDYSLIPAKEGEVPREALRIATMLGVSQQVLDLASEYLTNE